MSLQLLSHRWAPEVILALSDAPDSWARFNRLMEAIPGISDRMLTERLKELVELRLAERAVRDGRPVKVYYRLTPAGSRLVEPLRALQAVS